jgi:hypothetical protein
LVVFFGLAIDAAAAAEDRDGTDAAPTSESSANGVSAKGTPSPSRDEGRESRAKVRSKKGKDQPSELLALSSALEVEPEVVCKNVAVTGSTIKRRICGTAQQWEDARKKKLDAAQEGMRQMRDQSTVVTTPPNYPQSPTGR